MNNKSNNFERQDSCNESFEGIIELATLDSDECLVLNDVVSDTYSDCEPQDDKLATTVENVINVETNQFEISFKIEQEQQEYNFTVSYPPNVSEIDIKEEEVVPFIKQEPEDICEKLVINTCVEGEKSCVEDEINNDIEANNGNDKVEEISEEESDQLTIDENTEEIPAEENTEKRKLEANFKSELVGFFRLYDNESKKSLKNKLIKKFKTIDVMPANIYSAEPNIYQHLTGYCCDTCNVSVKEKNDLINHVLSTHKRYHLWCCFCKDFCPPNVIFGHLEEHFHDISYSETLTETGLAITAFMCNFTCQICKKSFSMVTNYREDHLKNHMIDHLKIPQKCEKCKRTFQNKGILRRHMFDHRVHSCSACDLTFHTKKTLQNHLNYHLPEPLICEVCEKHYFIKHRFLKHVNSHFKFDCNMCKRKFSTETKLRQHAKIHDKNYDCKKCGKNDFTSVNELIKHNDFHDQENFEYKCLKCVKVFDNMVEYSLHSCLATNKRFKFSD